MKESPEHYCLRKFEEWWDKNQGNTMTHSKYLARKAWKTAWFKRLTVIVNN